LSNWIDELKFSAHPSFSGAAMDLQGNKSQKQLNCTIFNETFALGQ